MVNAYYLKMRKKNLSILNIAGQPVAFFNSYLITHFETSKINQLNCLMVNKLTILFFTRRKKWTHVQCFIYVNSHSEGCGFCYCPKLSLRCKNSIKLYSIKGKIFYQRRVCYSLKFYPNIRYVFFNKPNGIFMDIS